MDYPNDHQPIGDNSPLSGDGVSSTLPPELEEDFYFSKFVSGYNEIAKMIHETAVEKGWWDFDRNEGEILMLIVSELAEALEGLRHDNPPDDKVPEFSSVETELADAIIRIMDYGKGRGYRVGEALVAKLKYNRTRERMHGGKKF